MQAQALPLLSLLHATLALLLPSERVQSQESANLYSVTGRPLALDFGQPGAESCACDWTTSPASKAPYIIIQHPDRPRVCFADPLGYRPCKQTHPRSSCNVLTGQGRALQIHWATVPASESSYMIFFVQRPSSRAEGVLRRSIGPVQPGQTRA